MSKHLSALTLMALLPTGISAQDVTAERVRDLIAVLERIQLATTDRETAATVFLGVGEAAERILENPASLETLPDELDIYFHYSDEIMKGDFGPVPDATRDMIAEAFVQLAIARPDEQRWRHSVVEAGDAGFERVDEALFEIYGALREREYRRADVVLYSYENRPPEQALPYLSRIAEQQGDDEGARTAVEVMRRLGQEAPARTRVVGARVPEDAATVFAGARAGAERILEDPASLRTLPTSCAPTSATAKRSWRASLGRCPTRRVI